MKKLFEKGRLKWFILWLSLSFLFTALLTLAANVNFSDFKSEKHSNKLEAATWNELMDRLDTLQNDLNNAIANTVPVWSVVAFTGACPENWQPYSAANNKYIMWTTSVSNYWKSYDWCLSRTTTWACNIKLDKYQMPPHYHYIITKQNRWSMDWNFWDSDHDGRSIIAHGHDKEDDRNDWYNLSASSSWDQPTTAPTSIAWWVGYDNNYKSTTSEVSDYSVNPVNIAGSYVYLNYCIKVK